MGIFSKVFIALSLFSATTVLAIRSDDPDKNVLEGKSVDNLQKQNISIRTANLNDFRDQQIDGFSKQPQLGFNFTKSILDRVNPKLKSFDSEMKIESIQKDKYGITHIRMQQYHKNIAVSGGQIIVHMNKDRAIVGVTGKWAPTMSINATPSLSSTKVKAAITLDAGFLFKQEPTLIYFDNRLAYEYIIEGKKNGPVKDRYIVDAQSGEVLLKASLIKHAGPGNDGSHVQLNGETLKGEGSGTVDIMGWHNTNGNYFMYNKDSVWGVFNVNGSVNDWEQRTTNSWGNSDPAAVSLGRNLELTQSCVMNVLGRKSFDDNNAFMRASVHLGNNYVNAYWDGESMYFGDGDGVSANALTVLDIVAHEYGHAVTQYSSNLDYLYESGALNESFSDISGTIVEFLSQPDGKNSYPKGTPGHGDWLCGEDAWLESDALRDLQNPNRFGQPSYYLGTKWYSGSGDNGGVHTNSGVQNFAFYLLTEGGSGTNDGQPYNITGLGLNQASEIAMYANIYLLTSTSQYRDSREAWMLAATILGYDTATVNAVWTAVGLPPLEKHLAVTPLEIHFGKIGVGVSDTQFVDLTNSGGSSTIISAITCSNPAFSVLHGAFPFMVPAQSTIRLPLVFTPVAHSTENGVVVIESDAMDNATVTVSLDGTGCDPAVMKVSPLVIKKSLNCGDSISTYVIIENRGEADLKIEAQTMVDKPSKTSIKTISGKRKSSDTYVKKLKPGMELKESIASTLTNRLSLRTNATVLYYNTIESDFAAATQFVSDLRNVEGLTVDVMDGEYSTPSVETLMDYDVVITASNYDYADPALLGDNLASYVDHGGKVIMLVASISNYPGVSLEGKIADPEYMPLVKGEAGYDAVLSPTFIDHPITKGIKNLTCLIPIETKELTLSGASLGTYSSGILVGAYNKNKPIVAINVFPYDDIWSGDLIPMVVNTIDWFGISNWLSVNPSRQKINIKTSDVCTLTVKMDATEIFGGVYSGSVHISNNDPRQANPVIIPCTLAVRGISKFNVSPAKYNFDTIWTSRDSTILIKLSNPGTLSTVISSVKIDNPAFTINKTFPMTLGPKESVDVALTFRPTEAKAYSCTINFINNAEKIENQVVFLTGVGVLAPIVTVTPVLIGATLDPQTTTSRNIRIRNTGGSSYKFRSSITSTTNGSGSLNPIYGIVFDSIIKIDPLTGERAGESILFPTTGYMPALSSDGQHLYVVDNSNLIRVINPSNGSKVRDIILPKGTIGADIGVNENVIAISDINNRIITILDKNTGIVQTSWPTPSFATGTIAMRGKSNQLFLSDYSGYIVTVDLLTGYLISTFNAGYYATSITYLAQKDELYIGAGKTSEFQVINATTGMYIRRVSLNQTIMGFGADELEAGVPWLSTGTVENVVPANSYLDIPVIFNSGHMVSGEHSAIISITDIFGGILGTYNVTCNMTVKPTRLLTVTPLNVDFDTTWTNSCDTFNVDLHNQGSSVVDVRTISVKGAVFSVGAILPMVIKPYSHGSIKVFFSPTKAGAANGQLTIISNATDNPKVTVKLTGTGFKAPKLTSTVKSTNTTLDPGSLKNITMKLSNSGDADYTYFARGKSSFTSIAQSFRSVAVEYAPVYVLNGSYIYEIDPTSGRQIGKSIFVGDQRSKRNMLAYDGEYLYLASTDVPSISVIDPVLRITVKTIQLPREVKYIYNLGVTKSSLVFESQKDSIGSTVYIVDKISNSIVSSWASNKEIGSSLSICGSGNDNTVLMQNYSTIFEVEKVTGSILRRIRGVAKYESIDYSSSTNLLIGRSASNLYYLNPETGAVLDSVVIGLGSAIDPSGDTLNFFMGDIASDEAGTVKTWLSSNSAIGTVGAHSNATFNISLDTRNMMPGLYIGYVDISYTGRNSADPLSIPCTLTVTSVGKCEIKPGLVDFGSQAINKSSTVLVDIVNDGNAPTTVTTATITNSNFTVSLSEALVVPPFGAVKLPITFSPKKVGSFKSVLKLTTNLVNTQTTAQLTGTGIPRTLVSTK